ncbi:MAG: hypothetical protein K2G18_00585, partial [Bacteroidales bacterium]|nr:hypothetical protein [Bacteroidales bacterium]
GQDWEVWQETGLGTGLEADWEVGQGDRTGGQLRLICTHPLTSLTKICAIYAADGLCQPHII